MAGDWIQIDDDLPLKPETQALCDLTDEPLEAIVGRLVMFWIWVDRHVSCPQSVRNLSARSLQRVVGGSEKFWRAMIQVGWLIESDNGISIPKWSKRFSKSAKRRALDSRRKSALRADTKRTKRGAKEEQNRVLTNERTGSDRDLFLEALRVAKAIWKVIPRVKDDDDLVKKLGASVAIGLMPESAVLSAAQATADNKPKKPMAYFTAAVKNQCENVGVKFIDILAIKIPEPTNGQSH